MKRVNDGGKQTRVAEEVMIEKECQEVSLIECRKDSE
jgi:hypothetical protein